MTPREKKRDFSWRFLATLASWRFSLDSILDKNELK